MKPNYIVILPATLIVLALIIYLWPVSKSAGWLLVPYAVWVAFATYLAYQILLLNR